MLIPNGETTTTEAPATTEATTTTEGGGETTQQTQTTTTEETTTEGKGYLFADGIVGEGDAPEWFKKDKYKTVSAQAEAYTELEGKFGAFTGTPKDGYKIADADGKEIDIESSPLLKLTAEWGADQQLSNEGLSSLIEKVNTLAAEQVEQDAVNAKASLGDKADERLGNIAQWGKNNLSPEEFTQFQGLAQNAGQVEVIEKLIGMTKNSKIVKAETHIPNKENAGEELKKMQLAKNEDGKRLMDVDPEYRAKVNKKMNELYNKS